MKNSKILFVVLFLFLIFNVNGQLEILEDDRIVIGDDLSGSDYTFKIKRINDKNINLKLISSTYTGAKEHFGINNFVSSGGSVTNGTSFMNQSRGVVTREGKGINNYMNMTTGSRLMGVVTSILGNSGSHTYGNYNYLGLTSRYTIRGVYNIVSGTTNSWASGVTNSVTAGGYSKFGVNNYLRGATQFDAIGTYNNILISDARYLYGVQNYFYSESNSRKNYSRSHTIGLSNKIYNRAGGDLRGVENIIVGQAGYNRYAIGVYNDIRPKNTKYARGIVNKFTNSSASNIIGTETLITEGKSSYGATIANKSKTIRNSDGSSYGTLNEIDLNSRFSRGTGFESRIRLLPATTYSYARATGVKSVIYNQSGYSNPFMTSGYFSGGKFVVYGQFLYNGVTRSSERENTRALDQDFDALEIIKGITPISYKSANSDSKSFGFLPENIREAIPDIVDFTYSEEEVTNDPNEETIFDLEIDTAGIQINEEIINHDSITVSIKRDSSLSIKYLDFIPLLTSAVQKQSAIVEENQDNLEQKISNLKDSILVVQQAIQLIDGIDSEAVEGVATDLSELRKMVLSLNTRMDAWTNCYDCDISETKKVVKKDKQKLIGENGANPAIYRFDNLEIVADNYHRKVSFQSNQKISVLIYAHDNEILKKSSMFQEEFQFQFDKELSGPIRIVVYKDENDLTLKETILIVL